MVTAVSWSTVQLCGTVRRLRYVQQTRHWTQKDKLKTFLFRTIYWMCICSLGEFARYKSYYYY